MPDWPCWDSVILAVPLTPICESFQAVITDETVSVEPLKASAIPDVSEAPS